MGKDKFQNEKLIEFAWPEDIWQVYSSVRFHVKSMSSAHVYLRLEAPIDDLSQIPKQLVRECAHLVKAHSIEGVKRKEVLVNYTPASNLLKTEDMEIGAVSFKNPKNVATIEVGKNKELVRALLKVKKEEYPNLEEMKKERDSKEMRLLKAKKKEEIMAKRELEKKKELMKKQEEDDYAELQDPSAMITNQYKGDLVDDFW